MVSAISSKLAWGVAMACDLPWSGARETEPAAEAAIAKAKIDQVFNLYSGMFPCFLGGF